ncbi:hypothetical protein [Legionella clemsonensis]|uniref:Uncharacterized protein n=1 Tax=Legionella clemsonensis TaxID=1867846 RepID=A0A222P6L9_9GAMM|nr:hypothetical protein [Legionella clemsonensis]ASQ47491.1 hypothetical protein clem_14830 [Legionella clemsonensis]
MKRILILTHAPQKTLGDPSAAAKLQYLLESWGENSAEFAVTVVVQVQKEDEMPVRNLFRSGMNYQIIHNMNSEPGQKKLSHAVSLSDLVVIYPTPHFLTTPVAMLLADTRKPVISFTEYDYDIEYQHTNQGSITVVPGSTFLTSGIGEKSLGIYVEQFNEPAQIHATDLAKLPPDIFSANRVLYFGYFNRLFNSRTGATPARFIAFAILDSKQRELDIILPLQVSPHQEVSAESKANVLESADFIKELESFNQVQITYSPQPNNPIYLIYKKKEDNFLMNEISAEEFEAQKSAADKLVRIINPFPLHKDSMRALMENSEPINLLTGDQSFSEALSLSKIIFYQAMGWKKKFYNALMVTSQQYKMLGEWFSLVNEKSTPVKVLVDFYTKNKETLLLETRSLQTYFAADKNLLTNFLMILRHSLSSEPYQQFMGFIDCLKQNPLFYADEKQQKTTEYSISSEALTQHVNYYLNIAGNSHEKNRILAYLNTQLDSLINFSSFEKVLFYRALKSKHPQLEITFTASLMIDYLKNILELNLEICDLRGAPIRINLPPQETLVDSEEANSQTILYEKMIGLGIALTPLSIATFHQFTEREKLETLQIIMRCGAVRYDTPQADNLVVDFLTTETHPQVLRQILRLLFLTPSYQLIDDTVIFNPKEPCLFFLIKKNHPKIEEMLVNNSLAINLLFEELFLTEGCTVKASNNTSINDLVFNALLFPESTRRSFSRFFPSSPALEKNVLLSKILNAGENFSPAIKSAVLAKLAHNSSKLEQLSECLGDDASNYLKDFFRENKLKTSNH